MSCSIESGPRPSWPAPAAEKARLAAGLDSVEDEIAHRKVEMANSAAARAGRRNQEFTIDFATMREIPLGERVEQELAKQEREIAILHERDERKREQAEQRRQADEARAAARDQLLWESLGMDQPE